VSIVTHNEELPLTPDEVEDWTLPLEVDATLMAQVDTQTTVIIRPHLVMEILGTPYEVAGIDIPVELPEMSDEWIFETEQLQFERPEPTTPADSGEADSGGGDDSGEGTDSETSSTSASSQDEVGADDGCNCGSTDRSSDSAPVLLGLIGLAWRRRRNASRLR